MKYLILSIFCLLPFLDAKVIINEIMYNPLGNGNNDEFVEIYNDSEFEVDLNGWGISDGSEIDRLENYPGSPSLLLKAHSYCLIMDSSYPDGSSQYENLIPDTVLRVVIEDGSFGSYGLSNSVPENIILYDSDDNIIDSHIYVIDQDKGISEERYDMAENSLWYNSLIYNGTPGFKNSVSQKDYDLALYLLDFNTEADIDSVYYLNYYLKNEGLKEAAGFSSEIKLDDIVVASENYDTSLAPGDSISISEEINFSVSGEHQLQLDLIYELDENTENNSFDSLIFVSYSPLSLILNEFMKKPISGNSEWFELTNISDDSLKLSDFYYSDSSSDTLQILSDSFLAKGEYFVIAAKETIFEEYGELDSGRVEVNSKFPALSDEDALFIYDRSGRVIDSLLFNDNWEEENGKSIEKINPLFNSDLIENWAVSVDIGTPGKVNSVFQQIGTEANNNSIKLPEKLISPNGDGKRDNLVINYEFDSPFVYLTAFVYNIKGQRIAEILNNDYRSAKGSIVWNCVEKAEHKVAMGAYLLYLKVKESNGKMHEYKKPFYVIK